MKLILCVSSIVGGFWTYTLFASPAEDLSAPSQEIRDAAAKILRETHTPPSRTNWSSLLETLRPGTAKSNVIEQLRPFKLEGGMGSGNTITELRRLDDLWVLESSFTNGASSDSALARRDIIERLRAIWVEPPANFTGVWTTYYANGHRSHEVHYQNGQREGKFTSFHPNGSIAVIQNFVADVTDGEDTGFYRSGKTRYKGQYRKGSPTGVWTWYSEEGSVESTKDYNQK